MSEHRRHTEPSEEDEINHIEEMKYRRAPVPSRISALEAHVRDHSESDEIPSGNTFGDQKRRSITHHHSASPTSAASMPELDPPREKFDEKRRRSYPNPSLETVTLKPTFQPVDDFGADGYAPYGILGAPTCHGTSPSGKDEPRAQILPAFFYLECTNFVAKAISGILSSKELQEAIKNALSKADIDILELVADHFVYKCSYHQGNRFIGLNVRVFEPPRSESGQLLDSETTIGEKIEGGFLVEVQLREGDRLHFSSLFRKLLTNFSEVEGVTPTGTLRYKPHPSPRKGEGLVLESIKPSRSSSLGMRSLLETVPQGDGDSTIEPLDEEMIEDVFKLVEVLQSGFLDTQADAAIAVAGLTSDGDFLKQLSDPKAEKAAKALCHASARLLVETKYRPARRQSAVIVANLSSAQALGRLVLDSDPPLATGKPGIVDSLVTLAMLRSKEDKEEEIGTRRECMRALSGLAKFKRTRKMNAMRSLSSCTPSGKGEKCNKLRGELYKCRNVLSNQAPWS